eukprot:3932457-Rhodomonas_salina.2
MSGGSIHAAVVTNTMGFILWAPCRYLDTCKRCIMSFLMHHSSSSEADALGSLLQGALAAQSAVRGMDTNPSSNVESDEGAADVVRNVDLEYEAEQVILEVSAAELPQAQPVEPPISRGR